MSLWSIRVFSLTPDAVSCGLGSWGVLIDPQALAPLFTDKAVGEFKKASVLYCSAHGSNTVLTLYSNQPWAFFSHVSKGTTVPKLVSLATIETVELQFVIDQSPALGIFLHPPSIHVACGVWKVVAPPSFLSPLRQSQWTTTLCVLITGRFFFLLYDSFRCALTFWKDCYPREQCCLFLIVLCSSYLLSSSYAKAANSLYKESSEKRFENVTFLLPLKTSVIISMTKCNGNNFLAPKMSLMYPLCRSHFRLVDKNIIKDFLCLK